MAELQHHEKWIIALSALIVIAAVEAGGNDLNPGRPGQPLAGYAGGLSPSGGGPGAYAPPSGYGGPSPYASPGQGDTGSGPPPDIMGDWEARERSNDGSARAFDQSIRDQTDIRDTQTGEVTTDVPNAIADPVIGAGAATAVPPQEL